MPGEIPGGEWFVELGVATILPDDFLEYRVEILLDDGPVGEPFVCPEKEDVTLSDEARWYKGDLHCHSTHSDGSRPMEEVFDYAGSIGLDFIALTDHNGLSHWLYLGEMQAHYPDLLLLYGMELTTYRGHANVFNLSRAVDYHGTTEGYDVNQVIEDIHADGGYFSPNHPTQPWFPIDESYMGWGWAYPETDWSLIDFFEVVNGPSIVNDTIPNLLNTLAILWWDRLLGEGYRITAIGGSDDHKAGLGSGPIYAPIGIPTNAVYAEALSPQGIFGAIKAGHVFIMAEGPDGPEVYFTARSSWGDEVIVGDSIIGDELTFRVEIRGGTGCTLRLWKDGLPALGHGAIEVTEDPFVYTFDDEPRRPGRIWAELKRDGMLSALTNPIHYSPGMCGAVVFPARAESSPAAVTVLLTPLLFSLIFRRRLTRPGRHEGRKIAWNLRKQVKFSNITSGSSSSLPIRTTSSPMQG